MNTLIICLIIGAIFACISSFFVGYGFGYGARIREEQAAYRDKRIRSALRHWHGHTTRRGHTILSPDVVEGGIH